MSLPSGGAAASSGDANSEAGSPADGGSSGAGVGAAGGVAGSEPQAGSAGVPPSRVARALVATHHYDELRSGVNRFETELTPSRVKSSFGRVATRKVRGGAFTQPLYVPGVEVPGAGARNVVFVTTLTNYVYAFDADDPDRPPFWVRQLGVPVRYNSDAPTVESSIAEIGIAGTPVISLEEGALYVVTFSKWETALRHRLHKLALGTGEELAGSPVTIAADFFDGRRFVQFSALLLADGKVFVPFGVPLLDEGGSGWLFAYDAKTLEPTANLRALGSEEIGPIWMGGQGPAWDGESVYLAADAPDTYSLPLMGSDGPKFGSRVLKLAPSNLAVEDWFLPSYVRTVGYTELGSTGPIPIPGADRVVVAGNRAVYLLDRMALGEESAEDAHIVQKFTLRDYGKACQGGAACNRIYAPLVYWDRDVEPRLYVYADADVPRAYVFDRAARRFTCGAAVAPVCESVAQADAVTTSHVPSLSLSSNDDRDGTGIVWSLQGMAWSATDVLRAYDAQTLETLWVSPPSDIAARAPFAAPVVTGGQVFVPVMPGLADHVVLDENPVSGPALAVHASSGQLVVLWRNHMTNQSLKVAWSPDGREFQRRALFTSARFEPALVSDGGQILYFAWVDDDSQLHVSAALSSDLEGALELGALDGRGNSVPFVEKTVSAPALAFGDGSLFLAWRNEAQEVVVASSAGSSGFTEVRTVLPVQASAKPPGLAYLGGRLFLFATNSQREVQLFESLDAGKSFQQSGNPMAQTSSRAVAVEVSSAGVEPNSYLFWFDTGSTPQLNVLTGDTLDLRSLDRRATLIVGDISSTVSAATFRGFPYVAWNGGGNLHVARYTPGELATYGLTGSTR